MAGHEALITLSEANDERLAAYRCLTDRALREGIEGSQGVFIAEGRLAVARLIASDVTICSLLIDERQVASCDELVGGALHRGAPVYVAPQDVIARTVGFALHRGVVAAGRRPPDADGLALARRLLTRADAPTFLVAEALNDHENLGALFRNAAALGAAAVLLDPRCADPLYRRSVRVSLGHVLSVPFGRLTPWPGALAELRRAGVVLAALAPHAGDAAVAPAELAQRCAGRPVALLLGAEGPGLSHLALAEADVHVTIPMSANVDSLNVATAAAIGLYALTRPPE